ncbi:hypothetical protein ACC679_38090, partial [Rhizobium ruizarguesonis]
SVTDSPLVRSLIFSGLATRDELEIGIVVDECGRTKASSLHGLFAMGPLGLGSLPYIDLVPQIVLQSHASASLLSSWIGDVAKSAARRHRL